MISSALERLRQLCPKLLADLGFRLIEESKEPERRYTRAIFQSGNLRARFQYDRYYREDTLALAPAEDPKDWWGIEIISEFLGIAQTTDSGGSDNSEWLSFCVGFLREHHQRLQQMFHPKKFLEVRRHLSTIGHRRSRRLLPKEAFRLADERALTDLLSSVGTAFTSNEKRQVQDLLEAREYEAALRKFIKMIIEFRKPISATTAEKCVELATNMGLTIEECDRLKEC